MSIPASFPSCRTYLGAGQESSPPALTAPLVCIQFVSGNQFEAGVDWSIVLVYLLEIQFETMARLTMQKDAPWANASLWQEFERIRDGSPAITKQQLQDNFSGHCRNAPPTDAFTTDLFRFLLRRLGVPEWLAVSPGVARERLWFLGDIRPLPHQRAMKTELSEIMLHGYLANALFQYGSAAIYDCEPDQMLALLWEFKKHYWAFIYKGETFLHNMRVNLMLMATYTPFWTEIPWDSYYLVHPL